VALEEGPLQVTLLQGLGAAPPVPALAHTAVVPELSRQRRGEGRGSGEMIDTRRYRVLPHLQNTVNPLIMAGAFIY